MDINFMLMVGQLLTLFSASNYCNEFNNDGGVANIDSTLNINITSFKPYN